MLPIVSTFNIYWKIITLSFLIKSSGIYLQNGLKPKTSSNAITPNDQTSNFVVSFVSYVVKYSGGR